MSSRTVVVVDDEDSIKFLYERMFKKEIREGLFKIDFCISGEEAIDKIKNGSITNIALIISDINMPGISGFELLKELKQFNSELVIFMSSAYTDDERMSHAKELGAADYITKPVDFVALRDKIKNKL